MANQEYIQLIARLSRLDKTITSNVNDDDVLIVIGCLLLLKREGLYPDPKHWNEGVFYDDEGVAIDMQIDLLGKGFYKEHRLSKYKDFFRRIIFDRMNKLSSSYLTELFHIFLEASDEVIERHSKDIFDIEIKNRLGRFGVAPSVMQPTELTTLINHFCDFKKMDSYYNPFAGLASLALDLPSHFEYVGEEITESYSILAELRILIHKAKARVSMTNADSLKNLNLDHKNETNFDFIGCNPPLNLKLNKDFRSNYPLPINHYWKADAFIINQSFERLKPEGKMVFLISNRFLSPDVFFENDLIKKLVQGGHLEKVIALPQRILSYTGVNMNLLVINKKGNIENRVEFIDASEKYIPGKGKVNLIDVKGIIEIFSDSKHSLKRYVSKDEVAENRYDLLVNKYVVQSLELSANEEKNLLPLKDLIKPIPTNRKKPKANVRIVRIRDLAEDSLQFVKTFEDIEMREVKHSVGLLQPNSLILATTWKKLKPTLYKGSKEDIYFETSLMIACEVNENIVDVEYLISELNKDYVQKQIEQFSTGMQVQRVSKKDLLQIKIVVPSKGEQQRRMLEYKQSIILKNKEKFEDLQKQLGIDIADENSFLRHKISGTLNNVLGSFAKLKTIIDSQVSIQLPEVYGYKVNPRYDATLKDYLDRMDRDLDSIQKAVKIVGQELSLLDMKLETIDFFTIVNDYIAELSSRPNINFEIWDETEAFKYEKYLSDPINEKIKEAQIMGNVGYLYQAFDNIVQNAQQHGFQGEEGILEISIFTDYKNSQIELHFCNTGNPLPENFTNESFKRKGSKVGKNAGDGNGGWLINEIVKAHQGLLDVHNENDDYDDDVGSMFPTRVKLVFPTEFKV